MNHNNPLNVVSNKDLYHLATKKLNLLYMHFQMIETCFTQKSKVKTKCSKNMQHNV